MLFKLLIVLHSFVLLTSAKECKSGQNCELRCCTLPGADVLCRERCLGLSCELDVHCDGDCCVNSTCSSCLLKRFVNVWLLIDFGVEEKISGKNINSC